MTDNWDFYFLQVEDKPASMYVDLGAIDVAPVAELPVMAYVRLRMNAPREDGLSSREEFDALVAIEDHLEKQLAGAGGAYVGRCTTNACRDFFFYLADAAGWDARVADCMRAFPDYRFEADTRSEPDWSSYLDYLYPSPADEQTIGNRRVCDALSRNGDLLNAAREIDHWAYFPDPRGRDAFLAAAHQLGFATRVLSNPDDEDPRYGAQVWRADVPSFAGIDGITLPLFNLAQEHGGEYDGWESVTVT